MLSQSPSQKFHRGVGVAKTNGKARNVVFCQIPEGQEGASPDKPQLNVLQQKEFSQL